MITEFSSFLRVVLNHFVYGYWTHFDLIFWTNSKSRKQLSKVFTFVLKNNNNQNYNNNNNNNVTKKRVNFRTDLSSLDSSFSDGSSNSVSLYPRPQSVAQRILKERQVLIWPTTQFQKARSFFNNSQTCLQ